MQFTRRGGLPLFCIGLAALLSFPQTAWSQREEKDDSTPTELREVLSDPARVLDGFRPISTSRPS